MIRTNTKRAVRLGSFESWYKTSGSVRWRVGEGVLPPIGLSGTLGTGAVHARVAGAGGAGAFQGRLPRKKVPRLGCPCIGGRNLTGDLRRHAPLRGCRTRGEAAREAP
jgi:hypothetical protein